MERGVIRGDRLQRACFFSALIGWRPVTRAALHRPISGLNAVSGDALKRQAEPYANRSCRPSLLPVALSLSGSLSGRPSSVAFTSSSVFSYRLEERERSDQVY